MKKWVVYLRWIGIAICNVTLSVCLILNGYSKVKKGRHIDGICILGAGIAFGVTIMGIALYRSTKSKGEK